MVLSSSAVLLPIVLALQAMVMRSMGCRAPPAALQKLQVDTDHTAGREKGEAAVKT